MSRFYWTAYDRLRFAARTLLEQADASALRAHNAFWPAGTELSWVEERLWRLLEELDEQIELPEPGACGNSLATYDIHLPDGYLVRLGVESDGRIVIFQPLTGSSVIRLSCEEACRLYETIFKPISWSRE